MFYSDCVIALQYYAKKASEHYRAGNMSEFNIYNEKAAKLAVYVIGHGM